MREDGGPKDRGLEAFSKDWVTIWQSELTAMAADRELREGWAALMALWAQAAMSAAMGAAGLAGNFDPFGPDERAPRSAAADAAPRAAPAAAAPDAGGDAIERLHRRITALEERLRAIERGAPLG